MENLTATGFILSIIGSGAFGSLTMALLNRRKTAVETDAVIQKMYGDMLEDLRKQLAYQGTQISNLQSKEVEYLKIISNSQKTERDLRNKVREQDNQIKRQELRIQELEDKLPVTTA